MDEDLRSLPAAIDAERTILGAILLDNSAHDEAAERLTPADFFLDAHRRIFARMNELSMKSEAIDIVTLADALKKKKELDAVGGVAFISSLVDGVPHSPSIKNYVDIVKDKKLLRNLIAASERSITSAFDGVQDVRELAAIVQREVGSVIAEATRNKAQLIGDFANDVFVEVAEQRRSNKAVVGLHTSTNALDETLGGFRKGENIVIAGWTGSGKSVFAMQAALRTAKQDIPAGVFSIEMRKEELLLRLAASESGINHLKLRNPTSLSDEEMEKLATAMSELKRLPLWIDDTGSMHIHELAARGRMMVAKGCKQLVVDYLQLLHADGKDTREVVNNSSKGIRELAKSSRVPVLNLSQLARPKEGTRRKPTIYDLKESGNIEQDAHVVLLLYRPIDKEGNFYHEDEIIVGKHRGGMTGFLPHYFHGSTLEWRDREVVKKEDKPKEAVKDGKAAATAAEHEPQQLNLTGEQG